MPEFPSTVWTRASDSNDYDHVSGPPLSGPITAPFKNIDPAHPTWHSGVDIGANFGTQVVAAGAGVVDQVGLDGQPPFGGVFGNCVTIKHPDGTFALYAHFQHPPLAAVGTAVQVGDPLGYVGMTGQTTGPHLHWGLAVATNPYFAKEAFGGLLDPLDFVGSSAAREVAVTPSALQVAAGLELQKFGEFAIKFAGDIQQGSPRPIAQQNMDWLQGRLTQIRAQIDAM